MAQKNETPILIASLLVTVGLVGGGLWWLTQRPGTNLGSWLPPQTGQTTAPQVGQLRDRLSTGAQVLVAAKTSPAKQAAVQAYAAGDWATAVSQFEAALQANRNDPEALIYLNNARIGDRPALKIAVSVPIGGNLNVAEEILRGAAQAQNTVNQAGGINGTPLQIVIANDDNTPAIAQGLARLFAQDAQILAVVGHNSSDASIAAAPIYQEQRLVMISPTSTSTALSGLGSYIFRTVPSVRFDATALSRYALQTARTPNVAICADANSKASQSLKEEFTSILFSDGGRVVPITCDFAAPNFDPNAAVSQAISAGADAILLAPHVDRIPLATGLAQANQARLVLLADATMYTFRTLQLGQAAINGMVLAVAWHPTAIPASPFGSQAQALWGGSVNWRTAMAYDATQAIVNALRQNQTRAGLQSVLASGVAIPNGAAGAIQFLPSGDRNLPSTLVQIRPGQGSGTGYDFVPVRP